MESHPVGNVCSVDRDIETAEHDRPACVAQLEGQQDLVTDLGLELEPTLGAGADRQQSRPGGLDLVTLGGELHPHPTLPGLVVEVGDLHPGGRQYLTAGRARADQLRLRPVLVEREVAAARVEDREPGLGLRRDPDPPVHRGHELLAVGPRVLAERRRLSDALHAMEKSLRKTEAEVFSSRTELDLLQTVVDLRIEEATEALTTRVAPRLTRY